MSDQTPNRTNPAATASSDEGSAEEERASTREQRAGKARRRVIVHPPEGTDPHPEAEPERFGAGENLARLREDVPPHWGARSDESD